MSERLRLTLELDAAGEHYRSLNILASPLQSTRRVFDLMPRATEQDWANIALRMAKVPEALSRYRDTLEAGIVRERVASRRQVEACALQAEVWERPPAGRRPASSDGLAEEFGRFRRRVARASPSELQQRRGRGERRLRRLRPLPAPALPPAREAARRRRRGPLRPRRARLQRRRAGPARDVRMGLGRAAAHRGPDGGGRRADPARRVASRRRSSCWRPTRSARSRASTPSSAGCRSCRTRRSRSWTGGTSRFPSRCGASRR